MPYELDDNEPLDGPTPEQPMKPATPDTERRASGIAEEAHYMAYDQPVRSSFLQGAITETIDNLQQAIETMLDQPDTLPAIIDQAVEVASGTTRYINSLTSKCRVCGYQESLDLPEETSIEDMLAAVQDTLLTPCPKCEEALGEVE